jgi:ubiquinone/menaquinone biosynthesis C-methylase UbiE
MTIQEFFRLGMKRDIPEILDLLRSPILNIGGGNHQISGTTDLDWPAWDADRDPIPYGEATVGGIHAYHFLEHVQDPINMLREFQRVLQPEGVVNIVVPNGTCPLAVQDLDHKHFFNEETFRKLFKNEYYEKNKTGWKFSIHASFIMGLKEENLGLFVQLVRQP